MSVPDAVAGRVHGQRGYGREWLRYPLFVALVAAAYYAAAELVFALEVAGPVAAVVWLPAGVGIAALYLGGVGLWPGVLIADLLVNDYGALPVGTALAQTAGNLVEIVGAAWLLRRFLPAGGPLGSVRGFTTMLAALVAGVVASATIGTLAQLAGGVVDADHLGTVWRTWWLGDFTAALVLVPLAAVWRRPPPRAWWAERPVEGALLLVAVAGLCALVTHSHQPVAYLVFPALVLAALRFGGRGATLAVAIATGFTVWNASRFDGPFAISSVTDGVVNTPAVHHGGRADDVPARRRGRRARGDRRGPAGVARPPRRGLRHRAAQARPRPPRRRPAAAVGARGAPPAGGRRRAAATADRGADRPRRRRADAGDRGAARARARAAAGAARQAGPGGRDPQHRRPRLDAGDARAAAVGPARRHGRGDRLLRHRRGGDQRAALLPRELDQDQRRRLAPRSSTSSWPTTAWAARTR